MFEAIKSVPAAAPLPRRSVRTFLIWLVLACLLPGVIGATVLVVYQYQEGRAQQEKDMVRTLRALVQRVDSHLLHVQAVAQTLSTSETLKRNDLARFHERAREVVNVAGLGTHVILRDVAGRQLVNTTVEFGAPLPEGGAEDQVRDIFTTGKPTVSDVYVGPVLKRPVVTVSVPVRVGGEIAYALSVGIASETFTTILTAQRLPEDWVAVIFDGLGTIVVRTAEKERFVGSKVVDQLFQAMQKSPDGAVELTTLEGIEVVSFYCRSRVTNWGIAVGIPRQAIQRPFVQTLALLTVGVAALFGIGLALARVMAARIAHSVQALTAPAIALGSGAPTAVPQVHIKEAAEVAAAIERAGELLKERARTLHAQQEELRKFKFFSDHSTDVHLLVDEAGGLRYANKRACERLGYDEAQLLELNIADIAIHANAYFAEIFARGKQGAIAPFEDAQRRRDGSTFPVEITATVLEFDDGWLMLATCRDITERKLAEQRVCEAALLDSLTGLPNRALVANYCAHLLAAARRGHGQGALLFIDLDRFKPVNDRYGHEIGDRVLQEVSKRLVACTRQEDLVGRLGGDEFVIVLPYLDADTRRAEVVARHVIDEITRPFRIDALEVGISPSIGISYFPEHTTELDALIHAADLAMYQAKQSGRANYHVYTRELDERSGLATGDQTRLKRGPLDERPVVDAQGGKAIAFEALARLREQRARATRPPEHPSGD
ncbi:diguanylate cyclase domain-containing protein [Aromatoleum buckelii]|uniref:diguanylate cyclase domain-containing protein n=1 Tax=Aromatoleum buckelii TaxID=200254 RepID=UPI00145E5B45|nr:diguanylate cyclase [Aromatoleum buckelii]MCK0510264.1 diguanylate cyclase [Aromatoleum buckelii]